jgi:hypothetical protein
MLGPYGRHGRQQYESLLVVHQEFYRLDDGEPFLVAVVC